MPKELVEKLNTACKEGGLPDEPRKALISRLSKPLSDPDWEAARKDLEAMGPVLPTAEQFIKSAAGGQGGANGGATQSQSQAAAQSKSQPQTEPCKIEYKFTKPTDADIAQIRADLSTKNSNLPPDYVFEPFLAGPTHPEFADRLNYLRWKGINTRKWVEMMPANRTMYRVGDASIDAVMEMLMPQKADKREPLVAALKDSYTTLEAYNAGMAKVKDFKIGPQYATTDLKVSNHGEPWYDYFQRIEAAKREGPEVVAEVETLYDYLNDPINDPKKDRQSAYRWQTLERKWRQFETLHKDQDANDWLPGTAGIPPVEIAGFREKLDATGELAETIKDAILFDVKNSSSAQEGRDLFKSVLEKSQTTKGQIEVMKEWNDKTKAGKAYLNSIKIDDEAAAAQAAADAAPSS